MGRSLLLCSLELHVQPGLCSASVNPFVSFAMLHRPRPARPDHAQSAADAGHNYAAHGAPNVTPPRAGKRARGEARHAEQGCPIAWFLAPRCRRTGRPDNRPPRKPPRLRQHTPKPLPQGMEPAGRAHPREAPDVSQPRRPCEIYAKEMRIASRAGIQP